MKPQLVALALGLILISAGDAMAQTGDGAEPCATGHRFEPGPVVNGHHRPPKPAEVEARTLQRQAWSEASSGACLAAPRGSGATLLGSSGANSPERVVELDAPSSQRISGERRGTWTMEERAWEPAPVSLFSILGLPVELGDAQQCPNLVALVSPRSNWGFRHGLPTA
jgi:hypothetical protein